MERAFLPVHGTNINRPFAKVSSVRSEPVEELISTVKRALRQAQGERSVEEIMTYVRGLMKHGFIKAL